MKNILRNQEELNQSQASEISRKKRIKIVLISFAEIILIAGSFYAGLRYPENKEPRDLTPLPTPTVTNQQPTKSPEITPTSKVESTITWRKFGENKAISFDYPNGWHIYSGWFEKEGDPIKIFLSPEPLDGAPRGGSESVIIIEDYFGNENPNAILERNLSRSRT